MPHITHYLQLFLRRPGRWLRRTRYMADRTLADLGLRGADPGGPAWRRDNPFLTKAGRAETRRLGISLRLLAAVLVLSGLLLGGLWLNQTYGRGLTRFTAVFFGGGLPPALFIVLTFAHALLIGSARTAASVSLAEEGRRGTLPDLLLTPLRRAEMLLAMGVGPARTAFLVALAGLPIYLLLAEFGLLTARDIAFLYVLYAWMCYAPPTYAIPLLGGNALTPETALGQAQIARQTRPARPNAYAGVGLAAMLPFLFLGQVFGLMRGGWLGHLLAALHLHFAPGISFFLFFAWPYYAVQILSSRLEFFHASFSPLLVLIPLQLLTWTGSALTSAAALSAGDLKEMAALPQASRARTVMRWTARLGGLCALGLIWKPWVESGDTALLAGGSFGSPAWDAAGLLLLLGGLSLPNVCARALGVPTPAASGDPSPGGKGEEKPVSFIPAPSPLGRGLGVGSRPLPLLLRRAFKRAVRPLCVAGVTFLLACLLGGLSPFSLPVYRIAGQIALAGLVSVLWAVGVRRCLGRLGVLAQSAGTLLLYGLPMAALSLPVPGASLLAALSPVSAWVRLFPDLPGLLTRFPLWTIAPPPSFETCLAGAGLTGLALMGIPTPATSRDPSPEGKGGQEEGKGFARSSEGPISEGSVKPTEPSDNLPVHLPVSGSGAVAPGSARSVGVGSPRHTSRTAALMDWITAYTDNPLFTYEMRSRTRSGQWVTGLLAMPCLLLAAMAAALAYPDVVETLALMSPFHFFAVNPFRGLSLPPPRPLVWASLASLLLAGQCLIGFLGSRIADELIARDRQRGIWGFLLLTPLTSREIFWGKVAGQTVFPGVIWLLCGLGELLLYALASPAVGVGPALLAWAVGQVFVLAVFLLGVGLGAALSTYPVFSRSLRGFSGLLFAAVVGLGVWGQYQLLPANMPGGGTVLAGRLLLGTGYALALAACGFWFAEWRVGALRRKDIAAGDGVE